MNNKSSIKVKKGEFINPEEIRDRLNISKEDQVTFLRDGNRIIVKPVTPISELAGSLKNKGNKTTDFREVRRKTKKGISENIINGIK